MEPQEEKGDPLEEGQAPWQEEVWRLAKYWAGERGIVNMGIDLVKVMEYPLLDNLNRIMDEVGRG